MRLQCDKRSVVRLASRIIPQGGGYDTRKLAAKRSQSLIWGSYPRFPLLLFLKIEWTLIKYNIYNIFHIYLNVNYKNFYYINCILRQRKGDQNELFSSSDRVGLRWHYSLDNKKKI